MVLPMVSSEGTCDDVRAAENTRLIATRTVPRRVGRVASSGRGN